MEDRTTDRLSKEVQEALREHVNRKWKQHLRTLDEENEHPDKVEDDEEEIGREVRRVRREEEKMYNKMNLYLINHNLKLQKKKLHSNND